MEEKKDVMLFIVDVVVAKKKSGSGNAVGTESRVAESAVNRPVASA